MQHEKRKPRNLEREVPSSHGRPLRIGEVSKQTGVGIEALRFYEKQGWHRAGTMLNRLDGVAGEQYLEVWRYEKRLM